MDLRVILKGILFSTHLSAFKIEAGCTLPLGCDATGSSPWKHTTGNDGTVVRFLFRKEGGHCLAFSVPKILKKTRFESQRYLRERDHEASRIEGPSSHGPWPE